MSWDNRSALRYARLRTLRDVVELHLDSDSPGVIRSTVTKRLHEPHSVRAIIERLQGTSDLAIGDRVIVVIEEDIESVENIMALWWLGAAVIPIEPETHQDQEGLDAIAFDSGAKFVLAGSALQPCRGFVPRTSTLTMRGPREAVTGSDLALIIYTSGSTGSPKGIMLTHTNVVEALSSITQFLELSTSDRIFSCLPLSFDYGLYQVLFAMTVGCDLHIHRGPFNPLKIAALIHDTAATVLPGVPHLTSALLQIWKKREHQLEHLAKITNTGGHLPGEVCRSLLSIKPALEIYPMYGLTECKRALYLPPDQVLSRPDSVGIPMPGLDAKLFVQAEGDGGADCYTEVAPGDTGELFVRGASIMQRYCDPQAESGVRIVDGHYREDNWLATGDLFMRDDDGFFYFKGRAKGLIKQGGYCLYSTDVESAAMECPVIQTCVVRAQRDKIGNEVAALYVLLSEDIDTPDQFVRSWLNDNMNRNYVPQKIIVKEAFPLLSNGKVDLKTLELTD